MLYLFVDGIAEKLHLGQPREAVLAAWGITETGHKVLLGLAPGTKEDTASCRDFLRDLKARGLRDPILGVTDGAPGLIRAFEEERYGNAAWRTRSAISNPKCPRGLARSQRRGAFRLPGGQPPNSRHGERRLRGALRAGIPERDGLFPG